MTNTTISTFGHGVGSETFPPVELDGKLVTLEVSSSTPKEDSTDQQISIALIDFNSKITLRDVTFHIKAEKGDTFLFDHTFEANNGFLVFNFVSKDGPITISENNAGGFFESLIGIQKRLVTVSGPELSKGGLYKFDIKILTANNYSNKLVKPLVFNSGISIPITTSYDINDPNFGTQKIDVITYYDEIENFKYDIPSRTISFSMPFEWTISNINQTSVVHEEFVVPQYYGDLYASNFVVYVNGVQLSEQAINIDDFFTNSRTVHLIISQKELQNIHDISQKTHGMNFLIKPSSDNVPMSSVTTNGQFRILATWEPKDLKSNSPATISFLVTDVFLRNKPVAVSYDFTITQYDKIIAKHNGISRDTGEYTKVNFVVPDDISGIVFLNFQNLNGNSLANTSIPIVFNRISVSDMSIPSWIKNNAGWWADDQIDDNTFVQGIEFLIQNNVITIPQTQTTDTSERTIPAWIKNNAGWWADGSIDDNSFVRGIQYLVQHGIIRV